VRTFTLTLALLALAGFACADEDDPEPPGGGALRKLHGTWNAVRMVFKGAEKTPPNVSYVFEKDKVTYTSGKAARPMTLKADRKRPDVIEMTPEKGTTQRFFFKIEKGELYLTPDRSKDPKAKPDFTGASMPVMVLKQEKKE
jgi:uncharacterized protein (TIGR03067 family)